MKTLPHPILAAALFCAGGLHAQNVWNGAGVVDGTVGTVWTDEANYVSAPVFSSSTDWDFSAITDAASGVTLSAGTGGTYAVKDIYFARAITAADPSKQSTAVKLTVNGTGTPGATTIDLRGNIYLPVTSGSVITLGSDLTLNLSDHAHEIRTLSNANVTTDRPVIVINSLIEGGGNNAGLFNKNTPITPALILTNDNNSFLTGLSSGTNRYEGYVGYTSIGSIGGGNSSLGRATVEANVITFGNGAFFNYIGAGDQASNRGFSLAGTNSFGNSSTGTTVTLNGQFSSTAANALTFQARVIDGATLVIDSVLADGSGGGVLSLNKQSTQSYWTATGETASNDGKGLLVLGGDNTYTGATTISAGTVRLDHANALGSTASGTTVSSGATLDLNGKAVGAETVSINGTGVGGNGALVNTNTTTAASLAGAVTLTGNASVGGEGELTLDGDIAQTSGTRTFTKVGAGALFVNGTTSYTGATTVSGGTLGGMGTIASATTFAAGTTLRPGTAGAAGQLTFGGNLTLNADAIFSVTLNQAAGNDYDRVAVGGTTALNGASLTLFFGEDFAATATTGQIFDLLTSTGTLSGQLAQGDSISATSGIYTYDFGIGYAGNIVTLTLTGISAVPEPSTWALLMGAVTLGLAVVRRRRNA